MKSSIEQLQRQAIHYYDKLLKVSDFIAPKWHYHKARNYAIQQLQLKEGDAVKSLPCGSGQIFECLQKSLNDTGLILGIDLSEGMVAQAKRKKTKKILKVFVIKHWYIPEPMLWGQFINWTGRGKSSHLFYQYFESKVADFSVKTSFNRGGCGTRDYK